MATPAVHRSPGKFQGCGRGVFGLDNWGPLRRPGQDLQQQQQEQQQQSQQNKIPATSQQTVSASSQKVTKDAPPSTLVKGTKLLAKYNYKANTDSPLGETELSFKQKDNLMFLMVHPDNSHWWKCQNEEGMMGYVPGSYLYVVAEQPAGLPWLQGKKEEEVENKPDANNRFGAPPQGTFKPYVSAYDRNDQESKDLKLKAYYCAVCEKQLNGPQPYNAHMNSKAHKEEVELAEHYANK